MRDYGNIPVLEWRDTSASQKARAQILHQEPVILQMPEDFDAGIDGSQFGCSLHEESGILYDCDGGEVLNRLATKNAIPELLILAEACELSSSQVDIDKENKRLIVHD
ncbi:MAG: hypothetical protein ABR544_11035 [Gammaproteobacteria bacterium]